MLCFFIQSYIKRVSVARCVAISGDFSHRSAAGSAPQRRGMVERRWMLCFSISAANRIGRTSDPTSPFLFPETPSLVTLQNSDVFEASRHPKHRYLQFVLWKAETTANMHWCFCFSNGVKNAIWCYIVYSFFAWSQLKKLLFAICSPMRAGTYNIFTMYLLYFYVKKSSLRSLQEQNAENCYPKITQEQHRTNI